MDLHSRFLSATQSRKRLIIVAVSVIFLYFVFSSPVSQSLSKLDSGYISSYTTGKSKTHSSANHAAHIPSGGRKARYLSPSELMKRPLAPAQKTVSKLFHQSWSNTELPNKFKQWSDGCREQHPDWEWVLWTDDDNSELIKTFLPWLVPAFEKLKGPIYKADLARNVYMLLFGGIYADLDMDCLIPTEVGVFNQYNISTISHSSAIHDPPASHANSRRAFFGRMGTDEGFEHSIPNAWMAAPPAHPFFLLELEWIRDKILNGDINDTPETITGPIALRNAINRYGNGEFHSDSLDEFFNDNEYAKEDPTMLPRVLAEAKHEAVVLPFQYIYPYSWQRDGDAVRDICWSALETFDAERCKELLAVDRWPSTTITFWSHTWEHEGHHSKNLEMIQ